MLDMVEQLEARIGEIDNQMVEPEVLSDQKKLIELNRKRRHLTNILESGLVYRELRQSVDEANEIISAGEDAELVAMAQEELDDSREKLTEAELDFTLKLLPRDPSDEKPAIVEIRAGTGGDEAGLFAADIYRMYQRYADSRGWKLEVMNTSPSGADGFKEIIFSLGGVDVYGTMKYESGVHRVQRVPATETQGRIHTSAITVAVFPEVEEVEVQIAEHDLKIDVYRSSGPGGQSVNTTDSAVRITHLPTGLVVTCQDEKSQHKNKAKALKVLRARLFDMQQAQAQAKQAAQRRSMVSSGDRSAKIRTYNFPQSRVTDHRINLTVYQLDDIMGGNIDYLIKPMQRHEQDRKLKLQATGSEGSV